MSEAEVKGKAHQVPMKKDDTRSFHQALVSIAGQQW
jgi:hypothetical protein